MDFYLVRHGDALLDSADHRRPLSDRGRSDVESVARAAAAKQVKPVAILHSDKLRAKQTAEILARFLSPAEGVRQSSGLAPEDDPLIAGAELAAAEASLMLVGHLPHLGRLAARLVTGDAEKKVVDFSAATMICLSRVSGAWELGWILTPGWLDRS
ncbi:MAG TPA: phosphohistidine phosphatase SixA [Candidatus Binatia bacterium]|jgi:phosphohistidine phosphatase